MNNEINDGGPAFPVDHEFVDPNATAEQMRHACGMTLLDYFAGRALAAQISNEKTCGVILSMAGAAPENIPAIHADFAYDYAEAMLAERQKRKERKP